MDCGILDLPEDLIILILIKSCREDGVMFSFTCKTAHYIFLEKEKRFQYSRFKYRKHLRPGKFGHSKEMIDEAIKMDCPKTYLCHSVCQYGNLDLLEYIISLDYPVDKNCYLFASLARNYDILKFLKCNNVEIHKDTASILYLNKDFDVGMISEYQVYNADIHKIVVVAAAMERYDILYRMKSIGANLEAGVQSAVSTGNVAIVDWLRENGVSDDKFNIWFASMGVSKFSLDIKWSLRDFKSWPRYTYIRSNLDMMKYLKGLGNGLYDMDICSNLVMNNDMEALEWAIENGASLNGREWFYVSGSKNIVMLGWLKNHNCPTNELKEIYNDPNTTKKLKEWMKDNHPTLFN